MTQTVRDAVRILREKAPGLVVDGEMQADVASTRMAAAHFPFSRIQGGCQRSGFPRT